MRESISQNTNHKTQNTKHKITTQKPQTTKHQTQTTNHKPQTTKHKTQVTKTANHKSQNPYEKHKITKTANRKTQNHKPQKPRSERKRVSMDQRPFAPFEVGQKQTDKMRKLLFRLTFRWFFSSLIVRSSSSNFLISALAFLTSSLSSVTAWGET